MALLSKGSLRNKLSDEWVNQFHTLYLQCLLGNSSYSNYLSDLKYTIVKNKKGTDDYTDSEGEAKDGTKYVSAFSFVVCIKDEVHKTGKCSISFPYSRSMNCYNEIIS